MQTIIKAYQVFLIHPFVFLCHHCWGYCHDLHPPRLPASRSSVSPLLWGFFFKRQIWLFYSLVQRSYHNVLIVAEKLSTNCLNPGFTYDLSPIQHPLQPHHMRPSFMLPSLGPWPSLCLCASSSSSLSRPTLSPSLLHPLWASRALYLFLHYGTYHVVLNYLTVSSFELSLLHSTVAKNLLDIQTNAIWSCFSRFSKIQFSNVTR